MEDSQDTKIDLIVIGKGKGLTAKPSGLLLLSDPRVQGAAAACPAKLLALGALAAWMSCGIGRGAREGRKEELTGVGDGRWRPKPGRRRT
jgi:hypothetical protein